MQIRKQQPIRVRSGEKAGIWLAWAIALGLHGMILVLPVADERAVSENHQTLIELQLTAFKNPPPIQQSVEQVAEAHLPEPVPESTPDPLESIADTQPEVEPRDRVPPRLKPLPQALPAERGLDDMSTSEKNQLTRNILVRQYITEESAADKLFGRQIGQGSDDMRKEFHYPVRQSLVTMLDQPMADLPFAYEAGLLNFAYDPGVKGDLQRFWDVITPEFGWRTNNGTEVRCKLILVIAGCAWK